MTQAIPGSARSEFSLAIQQMLLDLQVYFIEAPFVGVVTGFEMAHTSAGIYCPNSDMISVRAGTASVWGNANTHILHEMAHWTGHPVRLAREAIVKAHGGHRIVDEELHTEEMTAQIGMYWLSTYFGLDMRAAQAYCDSYYKRFIWADLAVAERQGKAAAQYVIDLIEQKASKAA